MTQNIITLAVGQTRIETISPTLARQVLEYSTGLEPAGYALLGTITESTQPPAIGQYWHGEAGVYVGMVRGENGNPDYPLVVPTDPSCQAELAFGAEGEDEPGAKHWWDGQANTRALVDSKHDHPAAQWAAGLEIEGHTDLYLPSIGELALCRANAPELFEKRWHGSSTQDGPNDAWVQDFSDGQQINDYKGYSRRVRAVRRPLINLPI